jgi:chromosome segregation ATPase
MFLNSERDQSHNNTEENKHMSETEAAVKMATLERDLSDKEKAIERMNTEVQQKDEKVSELETAVERLNTEKSEVEAKLEQAEKQLTEFANAEENRQWQNIKDNYIPPGMIADESKESSMRELYNTDKDQFWMKVAKANAERPPETHREGNEFSNTSGNSALEKEMSDLGISIDVEE